MAFPSVARTTARQRQALWMNHSQAQDLLKGIEIPVLQVIHPDRRVYDDHAPSSPQLGPNASRPDCPSTRMAFRISASSITMLVRMISPPRRLMCIS